MTERLNKIGRCYGMEINVDKAEVMRISRQPFTVLQYDEYDRSNVTAECRILKLFW